YATDDILAHFRERIKLGEEAQSKWDALFAQYRSAFPELAEEFDRRFSNQLPEAWDTELPTFQASEKGMSTRVASWHTLQALGAALPELMGGSADLAPSNNTWMDAYEAFYAETPEGRNLHFGVREMAMAGITNGMYVHGGIRPYTATFLVFSDYLRGSLRVTALSKMANIFVFTHDSIGVGEDGPTHQPIETLMSLRLIPNLNVIRPADANETVEAWKQALLNNEGPTALILTRQNLPIIDRSRFASAENLAKGAYVLYQSEAGEPDLIIIATGSEVSLAIACLPELEAKGINVRIVSMPSWMLFEKQEKTYRDEVLPASVINRFSIEAGRTMAWERWVGQYGASLGIDNYGHSAPGNVVFEKLGFTVENVVKQIELMMERNQRS
ncbi:MAG: transketolase, partial [Chloroflexi bacterium]|nr:transketolase [Chloroflexota bacterium]